jgi:glc operon protein GlcG
MLSVPSLGVEEARAAIDLVAAELKRRAKSAVVAVADCHGELIALLRLDGAPLPSIVIAPNKAWTAARERKPSADVGVAARSEKSGFDMGYYGDRRYTGWGGGIPVWRDGRVVGAVAVSGLEEAEDVELATLGANCLSIAR